MRNFEVVVLAMLLFIFLMAIIFSMRKIRDGCNFGSSKTPSCALYEPIKFKKINQKMGKKYMKQCSVVITGLARDSKDRLKHSLPVMKRVAKYFKNYKILIVENDSTDETREILLSENEKDPNIIILGCGENQKVCDMRLKRTVGHEITSNRIQKMSKIRNIYVDYIKNNFSNYDFMMVFDFDIVGKIYKDGLKDSFAHFYKNRNINGITANGVRNVSNNISRYYDTFAIFSEFSPSCFNDAKEKKLDEEIMLEKEYVPSKIKDAFSFRPEYGLIKVKSAFAGLGIYRIDKIIDKDASYDLWCDKITCEHTALSESLGEIYINSKMVLFIYEH